MEIRFKGNTDIKTKKSFYDEMFYICINNKKIRKKPKKRVSGFTIHLIKLEIILTIVTITLLILNSSIEINKVLLGLYLVLSIIIIYLIISYKIRITKLADREIEFSIKIDNNNIIYEGKEELVLNWDKIRYIIINNYTFTFVSDEINNNILCLPATYKDAMLQAIKNAGYLSLVVNNHDKYL